MKISWLYLKQHPWLMSLQLLLIAAYGTTSMAAQTPSYFATDSGTTNNLTLNANISVADADVGKIGNFYLGFKYNQSWYFNNGGAWVRFDSGVLPIFAGGSLVNATAVVARNADMSSLVGGQLYVGYGLTEKDMLANGKFSRVYVVTPDLPSDAGIGLGAGIDSCDGISSTGNPYPCCNNTVLEYGNGNCTWYAALMANNAWGNDFYNLGSLGNAKNWWTEIQSIQNRTADSTHFVHGLYASTASDGSALPVIESIAIRTKGTYGHVAWVTAVDLTTLPPTVTVAEQNCFHDSDRLLDPSFPDSISNSNRLKTYSASHFQYFITK